MLDPSFGHANQYATFPGISPASSSTRCGPSSRGRRSPLAAVTLSAYDPAFDRNGGVRDAALAALRVIA